MDELRVIENEQADNDEKSLYLKFNRPYLFEGVRYEGIDLSGFEDMTAIDMIRAQKAMSRGGDVNMIPEMTLQYACLVAASVSEQPEEFFTGLPAKEAIKLKNMVTGFLYGAD